MRMSFEPESPLTATAEEALPAPRMCTVEEVMARRVLTVPAELSVQTLAEVLLDKGISGAPVVDAEGRLVGMVSKTDLVREQLELDEPEVARPLPGLQGGAERTVGDVMTRDVLSVKEGTSLAEAAALMVRAGIHRVPVVTRTGRLVGQVSASDILRWVAGLA